MFSRLIQIDDLNRSQHKYLEPNDECYFFVEYIAANINTPAHSLIHNLKKEPHRRGNPNEWRYKENAIKNIAKSFYRAIDTKILRESTLIQVPPSKAKQDKDYDDRMLWILRELESLTGEALDIRDLIFQKISTPQTRKQKTNERVDLNQMVELYEINKDVSLNPKRPKQICVFDDVLTTGYHLKAVKINLLRHYGDIQIKWYFVARTPLIHFPRTG